MHVYSLIHNPGSITKCQLNEDMADLIMTLHKMFQDIYSRDSNYLC